jgi:hypothetical protein
MQLMCISECCIFVPNKRDMKKNKFLIAVLAMLFTGIFNSGSYGQSEISVISENSSQLTMSFSPAGLRFLEEVTPWGTMQIPVIDNGTFILEKGFPELQKLTASVIIPSTGKTSLEIISTEYYEIPFVDVCPSKGNLIRNIDPETVSYEKGSVYGRNEFWPGSIASVREPYILRNYRGQTIVVTPFAYNPVSRILRVYTNVVVRISFEKGTGINELKNHSAQLPVSDFERIYERQFLNYPSNKYTPVEEDGNMLIICYGSFMTEMEPFVLWKNQKGIPTEIVDVATIGGTAQIKTYVQNYYNTNGLTYLLLVGDHAQVPSSSTTAGPSDNNYAYISGSDHYPEIFVGRFSAENVEHVATQVQRSVQYEKYPEIAGTWYTKGAGIASEEGPGHGGLYDHQHLQAIRAKLLAYTYMNVSEHYEGTQGGVDLPGDPTATQVFNDINPGSGIIVYTGHGWDQGWGTSGFSNTEVNNLTNVNKLPFIWSVACVNGNFTTTTCFAEAWLRATHNGLPAGAIATMMSTINQSWNPPMCGQLEMVDILVETYAGNIKRSFGGISMSGCMKMNDEYGAGGDDMTDTWALFGDPSIVVRTDEPAAMTVTHPAQAIIGSDNLDVQCNVNGALVCLSINGVILGRGYVSGGTVNITFSPLTTPDPIDVVVTAYNYQTYLGQIQVIPPSGPWVIKDGVVINDASGNNNGLADFSENITLNVTLKNIGIDPASNVNATLSTSSGLVTLTGTNASFGTIAAGASNTVNSAFSMTVDSDVNDQETVLFNINAVSGTENWNSSFSVILNAPDLSVPSVTVLDPGGNNNGRIDPGETVNIVFNTENGGHATTVPATANISCSSPFVTITTSSINAGNLVYGSTSPVSFEVVVDAATPIGTPLEFNYVCTAGAYSTTKQFVMAAGLIVEDWETNDFTSYPWNLTNVGNAPWQVISGTTVFEGDFCARSGVISDNQQSILSITLNVVANDSISFYKKVSCEKGSDYGSWWDYLVFHINTTEKGKWDGEIDWSREAYYVTIGSQTFKWTYTKDYVVSEGEDAAWIDFVVFPPLQSTASVEEHPVSHYITCWPNPATELLTLNLGVLIDDILTVEILDVNGKQIYLIADRKQYTAGQHSMTLNVSSLSQGNYFIRISNPETIMNHPFVVIH